MRVKEGVDKVIDKVSSIDLDLIQNDFFLFAVAPFIRIRNPRVRVSNMGNAVLECEVEAFPEADAYWERGDGRLLNESDKYHIEVHDKRDVYKVFCDFCTFRRMSYCLNSATHRASLVLKTNHQIAFSFSLLTITQFVTFSTRVKFHSVVLYRTMQH